MSKEYLDKTGLAYFWQKIKAYIATHGGSGDMYKAVYDTNNSGVVDNAEALGGVASSGYSTATNMTNNGAGVISSGSVTGTSFTIDGHATEIGHKTERQTGTYALATGTTFVTVPASNLSRITLGQGTWIIQAHAAFESNNTGRRALRIYDVTSSEGLTRSFINQTATNGAATNMQTMAVVSLDSSKIFTLQLAQNSGSSKAVDLVLEAVRIA